MTKNIVIAILLLICIGFSFVIVKVENQRYALEVGMCREKANPILIDHRCLDTVQTRTSWMWHLLYAIKD